MASELNLYEVRLRVKTADEYFGELYFRIKDKLDEAEIRNYSKAMESLHSAKVARWHIRDF